MPSLPGFPGNIGLPPGSPATPSAPGSPAPGFGFRRWDAPPVLTSFNYFASPIGINPNSKRVFTTGDSGLVKAGVNAEADIFTFDLSAGAPAGPSGTKWLFSPTGFPSASPYNKITILPTDTSENVWVLNDNPGAPGSFTLQGYSTSSGSQLSSISTLSPDSTYTPFAGTSYSVGGLAQLAVWYGAFNPTLFTYDSAILQIYDVSTGSAVAGSAISFPLDPSGFSIAVDAGVFYDGAGFLYAFVYLLDGSGQPTGGTLYKFAVPSYAQVGSAVFSGAYGFLGDPLTGHIYLINVDGSVSDVEPTGLTATTHFGLAASVASNPIGLASLSGYPVQANKITNMMFNPVYGMSTDPVTSQFFAASPSSFGTAFARIQDFTTIDTLVPFADWGLSDLPTGSPLTWVPFDQGIFYAAGSSGSIYWYELLYSALSPIGGGGGGLSDVDMFLPNVWIMV